MGFTNLRDGFTGKHVAAFVARVARMSLEPVPFDAVTLHFGVELSPEVLVFYRLPFFRFPTVHFPNRHPRQHALSHVLGVGVKRHRTGLPKRAE